MVKRSSYKRKYRRRGRGSKSMYKVAARVTKKILNNRLETHYFDYTDNNSVSANGTIHDLSDITVGDQDTNRTGDKVFIKSLQVRGTMAAVSDQYNKIRIIIFQYMGPDNVLPTNIDVLQSTGVGTLYAPSTPYAKDTVGYKILPLWDHTYTVAYGATGGAGPQAKQFYIQLTTRNFKRKAKPTIQYEAGGTDGYGKLYMLTISDSTAISHPSLLMYSRLRFTG